MRKPGRDYDPPWWKDTDKLAAVIWYGGGSALFLGPIVWQFIGDLL